MVESHIRALCCKFTCFIATWADGPNLTSLLSVSQFASEAFSKFSILIKRAFIAVNLLPRLLFDIILFIRQVVGEVMLLMKRFLNYVSDTMLYMFFLNISVCALVFFI